MKFAGILISLGAAVAQAAAHEFPPPPPGSSVLKPMKHIAPLERRVEAAYLLDAQPSATSAGLTPAGLTLVGTVEVRCKATWNDSAKYRTVWKPAAGWPEGQRFCRAMLTALEGPNKDAGAGWKRIVQGGNPYVQLGCRATGGNTFDQYRSWIRARIDLYTVAAADTTAECGSSGKLGEFYWN